MLSPEVSAWTPGGQRRQLQLRASSPDVRRLLRRQRARLYHAIALVCPDEYQIPAAMGRVARADAEFYRLTSCSPALFVDQQFVDAFVHAGSLVCLSINRHSTIDSCIAITLDGILILHIVDKLYEELGLEGTRTARNFFEILIDLKGDKLKKPQYKKKVYDNLLKLGSFDFILKWRPHAEGVCPSSVAKYFYDKNIETNVSETRITMKTRLVKEIPSLSEDVSELVEWTGMLLLGADVEPDVQYISTYLQPGDHCGTTQSTQAAILVAKGLFTVEDVEQLYEEIQNYTAARDDELYWAALCFQSFTDSPCDAQPCTQFKATDAAFTIFSYRDANTIYVAENDK